MEEAGEGVGARLAAAGGDSGMMRRDEGVVVVLGRPLGVRRGRRFVAGGEYGNLPSARLVFPESLSEA